LRPLDEASKGSNLAQVSLTRSRPAGGSEQSAPGLTAGVGTPQPLLDSPGAVWGQGADTGINRTGRQPRTAARQACAAGLFTNGGACCSARIGRQEQRWPDPAGWHRCARFGQTGLREENPGDAGENAAPSAGVAVPPQPPRELHAAERLQGLQAAGLGGQSTSNGPGKTPQAPFPRRQPPVPGCRNGGQRERRIAAWTGTTCATSGSPDLETQVDTPVTDNTLGRVLWLSVHQHRKRLDGVGRSAARYGRWLCLTVLTLLPIDWAGSSASVGWLTGTVNRLEPLGRDAEDNGQRARSKGGLVESRALANRPWQCFQSEWSRASQCGCPWRCSRASRLQQRKGRQMAALSGMVRSGPQGGPGLTAQPRLISRSGWLGPTSLAPESALKHGRDTGVANSAGA